MNLNDLVCLKFCQCVGGHEILTVRVQVHEFSSVRVVCEFYLWVQVCEFLSRVRVHELCLWVCELFYSGASAGAQSPIENCYNINDS